MLPVFASLTSTKKKLCGFTHATLVMVPLDITCWFPSNSAEIEWCATLTDVTDINKVAVKSSPDARAFMVPRAERMADPVTS